MTTVDVHDRRPLLVVQHVPWEGPHLILDSFPDVAVEVRHPLDEPHRIPLPDPATVRGAIFMGGPMSANDADTLPPLADEMAWLRQAVAQEVPVLGICLGAQLLAKSAGAAITAAPHPEVGVAPVTITERNDPLIGRLAPIADAMHWHGEQFTLPPGAVPLAHSAQTDVQAFRIGSRAWGMLFHLEVDNDLLDIWLTEATMVAEARRVLGGSYRERLYGGLPRLRAEKARAVFDEFAKHCAGSRGPMLVDIPH